MTVDRLASLCLVVAWNKNKEEELNKTKTNVLAEQLRWFINCAPA